MTNEQQPECVTVQPSGSQIPAMAAEYEESQCTFFGVGEGPAESLVRQENVWHYDEVSDC